MLIRKHLVYIDEKSIKSIKTKTEEAKDPKLEEIEKERERILEKAREEAKRIVEDAERKAKDVLSAAEEEAKKILENARRRYENEIKTYENLKESLSRVIASLEEEVEKAAQDLADQTLPLVKVVVKKVVLKEIDEEVTVRRLKEAFSRILSTKRVRIRVNPEDLKLVKEEVESAGYELVPDPDLSKGDVVIETEIGILDLTTSHGLRLVEDIMDEVI